MNQEHFQALLEDLYDKYNHTKKGEIPFVMKNYNGQEFDAIKTFYFKYNFKSSSNYDPKAGTDSFIKNLIESYSKGERSIRDSKSDPSQEELSIAVIQKEAIQASESINTVSESKKGELLNLVDEKTKAIEKIIKEKESYFEGLIKKMDEIIQEKVNKIEALSNQVPEIVKPDNRPDDNIETKITLDFEETNIELPKEVNTMAAGTRFLVPIPGNKLLAFEIKDIFCDYVTTPGKCIKEINIQRI